VISVLPNAQDADVKNTSAELVALVDVGSELLAFEMLICNLTAK
jgi:hypothetical protein